MSANDHVGEGSRQGRLLRPETAEFQEKLGAYCRSGDPAHIESIAGLRPGRVMQYRRLVANVVHDALESAFPIAAASLEQELWTSLVDEFFEEGAPRSPRIWRMPFEFYSFHVNRESGIKLGLDWLDDLLFFEWMEIEIYNMPDRDFPALASDGDLMADRLVFNPEHEIIRLEYPVHQLDVSEAGKEKGDYYVLIYRSPETGFVHFLDLSALHVHFLSRLMELDLGVNAIKHEVARQAGIESITYLDGVLLAFLEDLKKKGLILGFALP